MEANAAQHASEIILDLGLQEAWVHRHCFFFFAFPGNLLEIVERKLV